MSSPASATSVDEEFIFYGKESAGFDVYPNPVNGNTLHVKFRDNAATRKLQIINLLGQVQYEQIIPDGADQKSVEVDVSGFSRGVYLIKASDHLRVRTKSLIRQ